MTLNIQNSPQPSGNAWWDSLPDEVKRAISYANSTPTQPPGGATPPVRPFNSFANAPPMGQDGSNWTPPQLTTTNAVAPVASPQPYSGPTAAADAGGHPNYGPAGSNMPWPSQVNPSGIPWTPQHPAATAVAANATPGGRDITVNKAAAPQKSAFTSIAAPNMVGMGGALGRGGARPMMSALDLSSLFGNHPNPT